MAATQHQTTTAPANFHQQPVIWWKAHCSAVCMKGIRVLQRWWWMVQSRSKSGGWCVLLAALQAAPSASTAPLTTVSTTPGSQRKGPEQYPASHARQPGVLLDLASHHQHYGAPGEPQCWKPGSCWLHFKEYNPLWCCRCLTGSHLLLDAAACERRQQWDSY